MEDIKYALEELKNSNYNIRIFKAQHLDSFIDLIDIIQLKDQLLPFLLDIIINFETSEEVLLEYSRYLKIIFFLLSKSGEISFTTLKIIFYLNNHDDDQVRKVSFNYLKEILLQYHSDLFIEEQLFPLLFDKSRDNKKRIGNCNLIPLLFNYSTSPKIKSILFNAFIDCCRDDNVYMRRQAASSIKYFFKENNQFIIQISDEFLKLFSDPSELVKVNIIESASYLIKILSLEKQKELITDHMLGLFTHEKSWKIKVAMSNFICSICYCFDSQFNEDNFLSFLIQTLRDNEIEVKLNTLANLQLYLQTIPEKTIKERIAFIFVNELCNDPNWNIRAANAVMILKLICQISWDEDNANTFYSIISKLIKDDLFEAKYYFIKGMSTIFKENNKTIAAMQHILHDFYYPIISEAIQNYNWRLRFEIEKSFYDIISIYNEFIDWNEKDQILKYVFIFFTDNAAEIRKYSLVIIELLIKVNSALINDVWKMQVITLTSKNYMLKIFALKSIIQLLPMYQIENIHNEVIPSIINQLNDNISNVRLYAFEALLVLMNNEHYSLFIETIKTNIRHITIKDNDLQIKLNQLIG